MTPSLSSPHMAIATPHDVPQLAAMRRAEGWSPNEWLLNGLVSWPQAQVLLVRDVSGDVALDDRAMTVRGTTVATAYGPIGFIGNVIVDRAARGRGLGKLLMAAALDWLKAQGARTAVLDATTIGRPLYERFGFEGTAHSWTVWQSLSELPFDGELTASAITVVRLETDHFEDVGALDREAFGGDRMNLIAAMPGLAGARGYVARTTDGAVAGYLIARLLDESGGELYIGPFAARSPAAAHALFVEAIRCERTLIPALRRDETHLALGVPGSSSTALELYRSLGVNVIPDDLRMRLDFAQGDQVAAALNQRQAPNIGRAEWLYGMLSTMVG